MANFPQYGSPGSFKTHYALFFIFFSFCFLLYRIVKVYDEKDVDALNAYHLYSYSNKSFYQEEVKYAIVIDAGSFGTRIHVYSLKYVNNAVHSLLDEVFVEIAKPLSAFAGREHELEDAIFDRLLRVAKESIPSELYLSVPVSVKATAGLRLLSQESAEKILATVRSILAKWPFVPEKNSLEHAVSIIQGRDEGIWAWITLNFLLGKIGGLADKSSHPEVKTAASMDLGGASVQVVFEISPEEAHSLSSSSQMVLSVVHFGGKAYHLFQNSFLRYGTNEARKRILKSEVESFRPCTSKSIIDEDNSEDGPVLLKHRIDVVGCLRQVRRYLNLDIDCLHPTCFFAGIPSPSQIPFKNLNLFAFSNFQEKLHPFLHQTENAGENFELSIEEIWKHVFLHCDNIVGEIKDDQSTFVLPRPPYLPLRDALRKMPNFCLDNVYIYSLLTDGFKILRSDFKINFVKKINGIEVCWALGAAIKMIEEQSLFVK